MFTPFTDTSVLMSAQRASRRNALRSLSAKSTPTCAARPQESSSLRSVPASAPVVSSLKNVV